MKMKLLFLLFPLFLDKLTNAQSPTQLQGKWKITAVTEGQVYYNLATDSIFLPKELLKEFNDDGKDSSFALHVYKLKFKTLKNYQFVFDKDSVYIQTDREKIIGTYQVNKSRDSIDLYI